MIFTSTNNLKSLFRKENIYRLIWTIVVIILTYIIGSIWNWWSGPQEVKVINISKPSKDTIVNIIKFEQDEISQSSINNNEEKSFDKQLDYKKINSVISKAVSEQIKKNLNSIRLQLKLLKKIYQ